MLFSPLHGHGPERDGERERRDPGVRESRRLRVPLLAAELRLRAADCEERDRDLVPPIREPAPLRSPVMLVPPELRGHAHVRGLAAPEVEPLPDPELPLAPVDRAP